MKFSPKNVAASFIAMSAVAQPSIPVSSKILQKFASDEAARKIEAIGQARAQAMIEAPATDEVSWQRGGDKVSWKRG